MRRVLILEDEEVLSSLYLEWIVKAGGAAVSSHSIASAQRACEMNHFEVLLSDVNLRRGESGLDFAEEFRKSNPTAVIVILSGDLKPESVERAMRLEAHVFEKPGARGILLKALGF